MHNNDADEEGGVAGELNDLPLLIAVLHIIYFAVVPSDADTHQRIWKEAVLSQNHKVGEKTSKSLDHPWKAKLSEISFISFLLRACHSDSGLRAVVQGAYEPQTYLSVRHADEAFIDQLVRLGVPRLAFHDVTLSLSPPLTMSVPRSMQRMVTVPRGRGTLRQMKRRKGEISGMLLVVKDETTYSDEKDMKENDHVSRLLGHIRACDSHGNADVGFFRAGESLTPSPVTATIAPCTHKDPRTKREVRANTISVWFLNKSSRYSGLISFSDVLDRLIALGDDAHTFGDGLGRDWVVPSHHDHLMEHRRS
ncbi:hypothetical protein F7725_011110, partial [Dissostichus mawsoni]